MLGRLHGTVKPKIGGAVKITLPGGIEADWTADEIADASRILTTALLCLATDRPTGLSLAAPQFVRWRAPDGAIRQCRLTATQFALVRFLLAHGPCDLDEAREHVWLGKPVADKTILDVGYDITPLLFSAGIPWEISCTNSKLVLQQICFPGNPGEIPETVS